MSVDSQEPIELPCTCCDTSSKVPVGAHITDAIPEFSVSGQTWGGGISLQWKALHVEAAIDGDFQCPRCGAPQSGFDGQRACEHCASNRIAFTSCGRRFIPGVKVSGFDEGQDTERWLSFADAFEALEARRKLVRYSTRLTLLMMLAFLVTSPVILFFGFIATAVSVGAGGAEGGLASFALTGAMMLGWFGALVGFGIWRGRKKRRELLGDASVPAAKP